MSRGRNGAAGGAKGARRATVAAPAAVRGGKGRWSARRKMTVVLELLLGAELEAVGGPLEDPGNSCCPGVPGASPDGDGEADEVLR